MTNSPDRAVMAQAFDQRDACGTGFIADRNGRASHDLLRATLDAVRRLEHRGAVSPDGKSSDGAGILTQIPYELFARELTRRAISVPDRNAFGVGVFFHSRDPQTRAHVRTIAETELRKVGGEVLYWRNVPVDTATLGAEAFSTRPEIEHACLKVDPGADVEQRLYLARRRIERTARERNLDVHIPSFSSQTIVYKGLVLARNLPVFFPDLADPDYATAIGVFHQRYSTNTMPAWELAQPMRFLAHNGEINTLVGNVNRMKAREPRLTSHKWGDVVTDLMPVIAEGASDTMALDNTLEFLVHNGRTPVHALAMLVPEAYEASPDADPDRRAFFRYHSTMMEPWDGPAALALTDGRIACAGLDRNGLRPMRYWITSDRLVVGSETGILTVDDTLVEERGRLGPGEMLAIDVETGTIYRDPSLKAELASKAPYASLNDEIIIDAEGRGEAHDTFPSGEELVRLQKAYGWGREHLERVVMPMVENAAEPIGSMGDDTPLAALSERPQRFYRYFKQRFAQVTNPPIDPYRERLVISLTTWLGSRHVLVDEHRLDDILEFRSPVLDAAQFEWLRGGADDARKAVTIDTTWTDASGPLGLQDALQRLTKKASDAVKGGARFVILSDRATTEGRIGIPMLLATSAVHHRLIREGARMEAAIICDAGDVVEDHDVAALIGYGASLVYPWLLDATIRDLPDIDAEQGYANARVVLENGLAKVMSKMGIGSVASYRGAQVFEALGLDPALVRAHFTGTPSRIGGADLLRVAEDALILHHEAAENVARLKELGIYRFRRDGEYHAYNPSVFKALHKAVREEDPEAYRTYARNVDDRPPTTLRDLLTWKPAATPTPLEDVEPSIEIARRFCTQAMSFGSLSRETHEALGIAMNRLGGKSNSGEGGEEEIRFRPYEADAPDRSVAAWHPQKGDWGNSYIKQVASGRFGVTPTYLASARELEIKMAQGSKPGEGGQIPGHKVTEDIARTRRAQPGMKLISPPPHHDIYSIEDLAQLIYDLKRVNERATVCVKLVSNVGIGTVASGVAKGYADTIQVSGHDGGTGASPLSSIKHAGLPWELGLAEVQQTLVANDLRGRVKLRVDGGLKTGRDVAIAAMLGAEEFGFGTAPLVALGCVMARQCHQNTCPVGVATQREDLRERFPGTPDNVVAFFLFVAEHVRHIIAELGLHTLDDLVGRVDLLERKSDLPKQARTVDVSLLLGDVDPEGRRARKQAVERNDRPEEPPLDQTVWDAVNAAWQAGDERYDGSWEVDNGDRSLGARTSGNLARYRLDGADRPFEVDLFFRGSAGQSFGAFCDEGMTLRLRGDAQDYVGKGMAGGTIALSATHDDPERIDVVMGNTCAYGATGGEIFAAGAAGERLAVRNSGATIVVEGCGDHGCEYMTGGIVVVLGDVGANFGAGMTGGVAYIADREASRVRLNDSVRAEPLSDTDVELLNDLVARYGGATGRAVQLGDMLKIVPAA
jgi:glutamate synthase domain-containing protein 2/glutamate synthase domain-containing protein 1/glutamate synthase domain-containing protein 3